MEFELQYPDILTSNVEERIGFYREAFYRGKLGMQLARRRPIDVGETSR